MVSSFLKPYYHKYDRDGDGQMDSQELKALFKDLGESPNEDQLRTIVAKYDTDHDGVSALLQPICCLL